MQKKAFVLLVAPSRLQKWSKRLVQPLIHYVGLISIGLVLKLSAVALESVRMRRLSKLPKAAMTAYSACGLARLLIDRLTLAAGSVICRSDGNGKMVRLRDIEP
jgi:hypothetical protein